MTAHHAIGEIPSFTRGDRLRKARQLTGLTTREFAEEIGVSQKSVTDAEGDRVTPRRITLMAYAMRTGVPIEWLETGQAPVFPLGPEGCTARDSDPEPAGLASTRASVTRLEAWRERSAA